MIRIVYTWAFRALLASATFFCHGCSDAQMAGGAGASQSPKKKPTPIGSPEPGDGKVTGPALSNCLKGSATANAGQTLDLELLGFGAASKVTVQDNVGTATISGTVLKYTAPSSQSESRDVLLTVTDGANTKTCTIKIVGNGKILIPDDGTSRALKANVYQLGANSKSMSADYDGKNISAIPGVYMSPNVNIPSQASNLGFPGMTKDVNTEDYVITFFGKLKIEQDGQYEFQVVVDDGAVMWVDSTKVINADGWATVKNRESRAERGIIQLTKGDHDFKLNYYQGPACCIEVVLKWKKPGDADFSVVPPSVFDRPDL